MNHCFRFYSVLLFLIISSGCSSHQIPYEDIDVIITRLKHNSGTVVERPQNSGPYRENSSLIGHVGAETSGSFSSNEVKVSFQYPGVEGKYYAVTPLIDKNGSISLLVILHPDTSVSHDVSSE